MWEIWPTLCAGASVVPYESPTVVAPELAAWLEHHEITVCFAPTVLAEALWSTRAALPRLRWLLLAGSALTRRPAEELRGRVCNTYGPTETTIIVSAQRIDADDRQPLNRIGRPIAGAELYVQEFAALWPLILSVALVRMGAIALGATAGGRMAGAEPDVTRFAWTGLVSQAGVALGLATIVADRLPVVGFAMQTLIVGVIAFNESVGPVLFRRGLERAGEIVVR
jgi:long-subunit acyl-CoA synthetase (AMP-forming)